MLRRRPLSFLLAATAFAAAMHGRVGNACLPPVNDMFVTDANEVGVDTTPPATPVLVWLAVKRGKSSSGCGGGLNDSCADVGSIRVQLTSTDDRTAPERIGYRFTVTAGRPPQAGIDDGPIVLNAGEARFSFVDRGDDIEKPIHFTMTIEAEDLAGNFSPPLSVDVNDDGG